jgi:hypothetical protein
MSLEICVPVIGVGAGKEERAEETKEVVRPPMNAAEGLETEDHGTILPDLQLAAIDAMPGDVFCGRGGDREQGDCE